MLARGNEVLGPDLGLRGAVDGPLSLDQMTLDDAERLLVQRALERYDGNVSEAAKALGLSRSALYRRLERHGR